jgi:hypothetical protein
MRVQIPAHTDAWMRGDRYGEVTKTFTQEKVNHLGQTYERAMARVRLDKSHKIVIVRLDACEIIDDGGTQS